jgi:hypothetical protein
MTTNEERIADVPLPECPVCGASGQRCKRPSGHDAAQWHHEREDLMARICGCPVCASWLRHRGWIDVANGDQLLLEANA